MPIDYSELKQFSFGAFEDIDKPKLRNVVWAITNLTHTEKLVLLNVIERYNIEAGGVAFPSTNRIARECCMARRTVQRAIDSLERYLIIDRLPHFDARTGRQTSNYYVLTEDFVSFVEERVLPGDGWKAGWQWPPSLD
jgi:DNA-binding MarR family transcriptional regulator